MNVLWIIYALIFVLGFFIGRIITTIEIGVKYNNMVKKLKEKYETGKRTIKSRRTARKEKKLAKKKN